MPNISNQNNAFFRQLLFLLVLIGVGILIFTQLKFFIGSFLGATTIYIVLRNIQFKLVEQKKWKAWMASLILVAGATLLLLGFVFLLFETIASEIPAVNASDILTRLNMLLTEINDITGYEIVPEKIISESKDMITSMVSSIINTTYSFAANIFMMLVILYFMLANGRNMERNAINYIPFKGQSLELLGHEVKSMIFSNAVGIPVIMLAQAIAACLIYWILGLHNIFFWAFITAILGLVPLVGTGIVWAPLGIYLMITGDIWQGIVLIVYGALIISNIDNLARIVLMKTVANTHPLIVIFGVILGIPLFGFWGIIFGPLLISGFTLLIKIYFIEYNINNKCENVQK